MLAQAMEEAGSVDDLDAIAEALLDTDAVSDYPVRALPLEFDDDHQAHYPIQHHFIIDGEDSYIG